MSKILRKPDVAGRMVGWAVELFEFGLRYKLRESVKGQHLADFAVELPQALQSEQWSLYVDGAVSQARKKQEWFWKGPTIFVRTVPHFQV